MGGIRRDTEILKWTPVESMSNELVSV